MYCDIITRIIGIFHSNMIYHSIHLKEKYYNNSLENNYKIMV